MARASKRALRRRRIRFGGLRRWVIVGAACLVALLYYRPVRSYLDTRHTVAERAAEVRQLQDEHDALARRVEATQSGANLLRAARRLSLVKPGERLFIVKGIPQWRREHGRRRHHR